ncbi:MAG: hypothetical protein KC535_02965 [Nanoarchaeota archaeon]|nr:hypothetical protein [Nanoarchaeota archaeon]
MSRKKKRYGLLMWKRIGLVILFMIGLSFLLTTLGKNEHLGLVDEIGLWLITSFFLTGIVQILLQKITGNLLERRLFSLRIGKKRLPITLFIIVSVVLKLWLFKF